MLISVNQRKSASKIFLCALCASAVILFNTAYPDNSTTSYFNFLSLPTAPLIQEQQPPQPEKKEDLTIIDFAGGSLIGSVEDPLGSDSNSTLRTPQSAIRITGPVAFLLKRNPVNPVEGFSTTQTAILKFTVKITSKENCNVLLQRYPEISQKRNISLFESDNIEIELVAQQNIVYFQIPFGERIEITNIEFLENTQLTENCNCKQVEEIDLKLLYDTLKY